MTAKQESSTIRAAWQELRSLFQADRKSQSAPRPAAPRHAPPAASQDDQTAAEATPQEQDDDADRALADYCAQTVGLDSMVAGRVHLLNLEAVKERLGKRWESTSERVHALIDTELRARLSPRDFSSRGRGDSYVIVFGDCSEAEAKLKVSLLTEAVLAKLFGSKDAEALRAVSLRSVVASADGGVATRALGSTDALCDFLDDAQERQQEPEADDPGASPLGMSEEEIVKLLGHLEAQLAAGERADRAQGRLTADRLNSILKHLQGLESQLARRLNELTETAGPERPEIALSPGLLRVAHRSLTSLRQLKQRAEVQLQELQEEPPAPGTPTAAVAEAGARAPAPDAGPAAREQPDLEVRYRPFWHARSHSFGVYAPEARLTLPGGEDSGDDAGGPQLYADELQESVDRLVLLQSRRQLEQALSARTPAVLAIPVHYETLARIGSQRRYLDLCRNIRAGDRRFIMWQLVAVPRQAYQKQLRNFVELLRPFGRSVSLMLTLTEQTYPHLARDLPAIAMAGVSAVGLDARQTGASESDMIRLFDYLMKLGEEARLKCYVTGLNTSSLVIAAACAGSEYIAGPAVAGALSQLTGVHTAELEQIYLHALPAASD